MKPKSNTIGVEIVSNNDETQVNLGLQSSLKSVKISDPKNSDSLMDNIDHMKKELNNLDESRNISHPISAVSKFSDQVNHSTFLLNFFKTT